jgi:polysaccharide export outer membrane protein
MNKTASPSAGRILRKTSSPSSAREELNVDIKKVLSGKAKDIQLQPDDILFVPNSAAKAVRVRAIEAAIQVGTGIAIWRP